MDAQTRFRTQLVGALPALVHYFDELGLAATIDEFVPWEGDVPLGTLVEVLVANRLLHPKALFRIGPWAQSAALTDYYGLTTLREKLVKIGAKVVSHAKYVIFQLAEVAVPRKLFAASLTRIRRLRRACDSG